MAIKITEYDTAEFLKTPQDVAEYLEAVFEDGEPALISHALGVVARAKGMTSVAKQAGVTREALYKSLSDRGDPTLSTFMGVLKALNIRMAIVPEKVRPA